MKLRTSFFNSAVLRKNLTRFAPVWILYSVAEVLGLLMLDLNGPTYRIASDLSYILGPVAAVHAVYALLVTACLFGDLFDSRLCNGLHAMPMRREGWLITNLVSGLVFALIPAAVAGVFAAVVLREYWWIALIWQGSSLLQFVFFFGVAVFSALCAGKRLGMIAIYGIFNFLSMLIYWVASYFYQPLLYGVVLSNDWFVLFCPVLSFGGDMYFEITMERMEQGMKVTFEGLNPEAWIYLGVCAAVGVVFLALAFLLYRKRHLETAGDFISFKPMRIFFLVAYTFAVGTVMYLFSELFGYSENYAFLVVGLLIGYFTGWMLLERTVKVFMKKVIVGFAVFALAFAGSIGLAVADPLGVQSYIPAAEMIDSVSLYPTGSSYIYTMQRDYSGWYITDPDEIAQVQQLHGKMLNAPHDKPGETVLIDVTYRLKNGTQVYRSYDVLAEDTLGEDLSNFLSDVRAIFHTSDWQEVVQNVEEIRVYMDDSTDYEYELLDPAQQQAMLEAIRLDAEAGNLAQPDHLHRYEETVAAIDVMWMAQMTHGRGSRWEMIRVFTGCENTVAFLETLK